MEFWMYIFMLTYHGSCQSILPKITSSRNSTIYRIFDNNDSDNLSTFLVIPNMVYPSTDESIRVEYKSLKTDISLIPPTEWFLSVHVDKQFFFNNEPNQGINALCYLQFSIENISKFVGSKARCLNILKWNERNISQSSSCEINIGRSPSFCSTHFSLHGLGFDFKSPTWGSINSQLFLTQDSLVATSSNSMPVVFNHNKPVNWTVFQRDNLFGQLSIGLPHTSIKTGSNLLIPVSITDTDDVNHVRILFEYEKCLTLNSIEVVDTIRWSMKTNFEHEGNKESGVIRLNALSRRVDSNISTDWPIVFLMNFTVAEKPQNTACTIMVGISKVDLYSGGSNKYFNKATFRKDHLSVSLPIDPDMMDIISFKECQNKSVRLLSTAPFPRSLQISTYLIQRLGERRLPQLISTSTCSRGDRGPIKCPGYDPQNLTNGLSLPVTIGHWRTVLYDLENEWRVTSWALHVSDTELNPISEWRVPVRTEKAATRCVPLYQSARLTVVVKLASVNSMGLRTFLGASLADPAPWIDVTTPMVTAFRVTSEPSDVVSLSEGPAGAFLVTVNKSGPATLRVHDQHGRIVATKKVEVYRSHWASVARVTGRCVAGMQLDLGQTHPSGEGGFLKVQVMASRLSVGARCHLLLTLVFNDGATIPLEDMEADHYVLEVAGVQVAHGALVSYEPEIAVTLSESLWCGDSRAVFRGLVNLRRDGLVGVPVPSSAASTAPTPSTTPGPRVPHNLVIIAACVVGGLVTVALFVVCINCLMGAASRRRPLFELQRRLGKSRNVESGKFRSEKSAPGEQYPSLLPPPGPIVAPGKQQSDWAASSESGLGFDRSSQGSHHDPVPLSTFRCLPSNGSTQNSESSSFVRQTSPISEPIVDSVSNSSFMLEARHSQQGFYWAPTSSKAVSSPPSSFTDRPSRHDQL